MRGVRPRRAVSPPIVELRCRFAGVPVTHAVDVHALAVVPLLGDPGRGPHVAGRVPIVGLRLDAQSRPATVGAVDTCVHPVAAAGGVDQERRAAPRLRVFAVRRHGEDHFLRLIVVGEEHAQRVHRVHVRRIGRIDRRIRRCDGERDDRIQRVRAGVDHVLGHGQCQVIMRRAGVHLGVEVDIGERHLGGPLVRAAVGSRSRRRQVGPGDDVGQLAHDKVVDLLPGVLRRRRGRERLRVSHQGDVAVGVDPVPVTEGTEEPRLRSVLVNQRHQRGIGVAAFGELRVGGLTQDRGRAAI